MYLALAVFEMFYLLSARYLLAPALTCEGLTGKRYVLYATGLLITFQLGFTYLPPMQALSATSVMRPEAWLRIIGVASSVLVLVEQEKLLLRRFTGIEREV